LIGRIFVAAPQTSFRIFLVRRFLRIYPAFLISIIVSGSIGIFFTGYMKFSIVTLLQNLIFLNGWMAIGEISSYNFVTWSLFLEFVFYLTTPLFILPLRGDPGSSAARTLVAFAVIQLTAVLLKLGPIYLFFWAGVALANVDDTRLKTLAGYIPESVLIPAYIVVTAFYSLSIYSSDTFIVFYMVVATATVIKAAYGTGLLNRLTMARPLRALGKISYSFYLVHATACILFFYVPTTYFPQVPKLLIALISLPGAFLIAWYAATWLYYVAERPYFRRRSTAESADEQVPKGEAVLPTLPIGGHEAWRPRALRLLQLPTLLRSKTTHLKRKVMDEFDIIIRHSNGRVVAGMPEIGLYAKADSVEAAIDQLKAKRKTLFDDVSPSDLAGFRKPADARPADAVAIRSDSGSIGRFAAKLGIVLVLFGLISVFSAWWIVGRAEAVVIRAQDRAEVLVARAQALVAQTRLGGRDFWTKIEQNVDGLADPAQDLSAEKKAKLLSDVRIIVTRWRPFLTELAPLFAPPPEPEKNASAPGILQR
jgi:peptidoglycan/LPS O-acetylase OafA/YrhL